MRIDIKKAMIALLVLLSLHSCEKQQEILFDTPFVSISDETGTSSTMTISSTANNLLTSLKVDINVSAARFTDDITVEYEVVAGDGLREGVDYVIQSSTLSPLVFEKGTFSLPVRLLWKYNAGFDPDKDNTLIIRLKSSSMEDMVIGYPGPSALRSTFIFTKK